MAPGRLVEVFSSVQGEGPSVGTRQLFLRLAGCNLHCNYCDTPEALAPSSSWRLEEAPGCQRFHRLDNPVEAREVWQWLEPLWPGKHHLIALTGGEPLLQVNFLEELLGTALPDWRFLLETNGTLPRQLKRVIERIAVVSMDLKLPAETGREWWEIHGEFLEVAASRKAVVKVVVTADTSREELERAAVLVSRAGRGIPFVLQPVTPRPGGPAPPPPEQLLVYQWEAMDYLQEVRVIPQVHRLAGLL